MCSNSPLTLAPWSCDLGYMTLRGLSRDVAGAPYTVLAVHGYLDNVNSIRHLVNAFDNANFIGMDLAGHGHSDHRPPGVHYNQLDYVQDIVGVINALALSRVILLGHSLGGILASIVAAVLPEKVHAVISIDAFGPLTEEASSTLSQITEALFSRQQKMIKTDAKKADLDSAVLARANMTDLSAAHCHTILMRNISRENGKTVWRSDPRLRTKSLLRMTPEQAQTVMQGIDCPFLVIGASSSFKKMSETFASRHTWVSQAQLKVIEGGHHVHMEQPEEVIAQIRHFVSNM
ncbi:alpha/beta hydrolase [Alteromonas sediminis]|uniref:Alpha/beta hydrolase n=1 Tax=Alteromonas sediminis TaxID=2259342 RepID=A0A3N5Z812_9ALTE|nr:alpha/beta hydrolase [Alteromonas sediminis]RPJ65078.1 alpha/beta hydrolase [Alteromonas sediminis]